MIWPPAMAAGATASRLAAAAAGSRRAGWHGQHDPPAQAAGLQQVIDAIALMGAPGDDHVGQGGEPAQGRGIGRTSVCAGA